MGLMELKLLQPLSVPLCGYELANTYMAQISQVEQYISYFPLFKKGQCQSITLKSQGAHSGELSYSN